MQNKKGQLFVPKDIESEKGRKTTGLSSKQQ
jgi:hypothetical protein